MAEDTATPVAIAVAVEGGSGTPPESRKRARADSEAGDLGRVAEIVMVLSAMGRMRGGWDPTASEKALMAEAREKLAKICESVELHRRKDLFTKEMAMAVVVDHGLNPPKENIPRPPKLSIAEKVANTKRKLEETKEIAQQTSAHPSQLLHVSFGIKPEGRSPLFQGAQRFVPDKASSMPSGGMQTVLPGAHGPALASGTSSLKQSQVTEVQRCLSPLKPLTSPSGKDHSSLTLPSSFSSVWLPEKTSMASVQATPTTSTNCVQASKIQHTAAKVEGVHGINVFQPSAQLIREQDSKTHVIQTIPANQHFVHQLPHVVNLHESSVFNSHNEISKMVQRILPPKAFDQPNWTPPSTDYISKPLNCLECNIIINDVESLLVCDACEKGLHLKCLLTYNQRIIPKAEWHCPRCLSSSNGKALPPKYGRVTRSMAASRSSSSTGSLQAPLEKKTENVDTKINSHLKMISNGNPGILTLSGASTVGHSHTEPTTAKKITTTGKQELDLSVTNTTVVNDVHKGTATCHSDGGADPVTISSSLPDSNKHNLNTGLLPCQMQQQVYECSLQAKVDSKPIGPQNSVTSMGAKPASHESNDLQIINKVDVPIDSNVSRMHMADELKVLSDFKDTSVRGGDGDIKKENMDVSQETASETMKRGCSGSSTDMHNVEWVGDAVQAAEERSYYQSCRIRGFTYELQDHVLISSNDGKLSPSKLQALWEDQTLGTKWAMVHHCYYPSDLPEIVPRPAIPTNDEVYGSNKASTILAESICGPCQVLPTSEFKKESERRGHSGESSAGLNPIFLCRWFYDESNGVFQCLSQ